MMRKVYAIILSLAMMSVVFMNMVVSGATAPPPPDDITNGDQFIEGDWVVTTPDDYFENETIYLTGNLTIPAGETLTLVNTTILMNCSFPGQFHIEVEDGGTLIMQDGGDGFMPTEIFDTDASVITTNDTNDEANLWIRPNAVVDIQNSKIENMGYLSTTNGRLWGDTDAEPDYLIWEAITNGTFGVTIDGVYSDIGPIDFTGVGSMNDVRGRIQTAIRVIGTGGFAAAQVAWTGNSFTITSGSDISLNYMESSVSALVTHSGAVGTDISGMIPSTFAAVLTGGVGAESNIANWQTITDGNFTIGFEGFTQTIGPINFTLAADMPAVAALIQAAIQTIVAPGFTGATCIWTGTNFIITSGMISAAPTMTYVTPGPGTDISFDMDCDNLFGLITTPPVHWWMDGAANVVEDPVYMSNTGIYIQSNSVAIQNSMIFDNYNGLIFDSCFPATLANNMIAGNAGFGLGVGNMTNPNYVVNGMIADNMFFSNTGSGIVIAVQDVVIDLHDINADDNGEHGVEIITANTIDATIYDSTLTNSYYSGVFLRATDQIVCDLDNVNTSFGGHGMFIHAPNLVYATISDCEIWGNDADLCDWPFQPRPGNMPAAALYIDTNDGELMVTMERNTIVENWGVYDGGVISIGMYGPWDSPTSANTTLTFTDNVIIGNGDKSTGTMIENFGARNLLDIDMTGNYFSGSDGFGWAENLYMRSNGNIELNFVDNVMDCNGDKSWMVLWYLIYMYADDFMNVTMTDNSFDINHEEISSGSVFEIEAGETLNFDFLNNIVNDESDTSGNNDGIFSFESDNADVNLNFQENEIYCDIDGSYMDAIVLGSAGGDMNALFIDCTIGGEFDSLYHIFWFSGNENASITFENTMVDVYCNEVHEGLYITANDVLDVTIADCFIYIYSDHLKEAFFFEDADTINANFIRNAISFTNDPDMWDSFCIRNCEDINVIIMDNYIEFDVGSFPYSYEGSAFNFECSNNLNAIIKNNYLPIIVDEYHRRTFELYSDGNITATIENNDIIIGSDDYCRDNDRWVFYVTANENITLDLINNNITITDAWVYTSLFYIESFDQNMDLGFEGNDIYINGDLIDDYHVDDYTQDWKPVFEIYADNGDMDFTFIDNDVDIALHGAHLFDVESDNMTLAFENNDINIQRYMFDGFEFYADNNMAASFSQNTIVMTDTVTTTYMYENKNDFIEFDADAGNMTLDLSGNNIITYGVGYCIDRIFNIDASIDINITIMDNHILSKVNELREVFDVDADNGDLTAIITGNDIEIVSLGTDFPELYSVFILESNDNADVFFSMNKYYGNGRIGSEGLLGVNADTGDVIVTDNEFIVENIMDEDGCSFVNLDIYDFLNTTISNNYFEYTEMVASLDIDTGTLISIGNDWGTPGNVSADLLDNTILINILGGGGPTGGGIISIIGNGDIYTDIIGNDIRYNHIAIFSNDASLEGAITIGASGGSAYADNIFARISDNTIIADFQKDADAGGGIKIASQNNITLEMNNNIVQGIWDEIYDEDEIYDFGVRIGEWCSGASLTQNVFATMNDNVFGPGGKASALKINAQNILELDMTGGTVAGALYGNWCGGGDEMNGNGITLLANTMDIDISGVDVYDNRGAGIYIEAVMDGDVDISDCNIYSNNWHGIYLVSLNGVLDATGSIENVQVYDNGGNWNGDLPSVGSGLFTMNTIVDLESSFFDNPDAEFELNLIACSNVTALDTVFNKNKVSVEGSPASLIGDMAEGFQPAWQGVSNGSFRIGIDGVFADIDGLDFSGIVTMNDVADVIENGLQAVGSGGFTNATCIWDGMGFVITSGTVGRPSAITAATSHSGANGTDISGNVESSYSATLTGGTAADGDVLNWNSTNDGSFTISMDGSLWNLAGIDFTTATTMDDVAAIIQTALQAVPLTGFLAATCTWNGTAFTIMSGTQRPTTSITNVTAGTSGTDVSGLMDCGDNGTITITPVIYWMACANGVTIVPGNSSALTVQWYMHVKAEQQGTGRGLPNSMVEVRDINGVLVASGVTGMDGYVHWIIGQEYFQLNNSITMYTPHTISASKGASSGNVVSTIDMSKDIIIILDYVTGPPTADAGSDQTVDEDTVVTFDGSGSTDDVFWIINWTWDFIFDNQTMELYGVNPTYIFTEPGTYNVTLTVTDYEGFTDTAMVSIVVLDVTPPIAVAGPDQIVDEDTVVSFNGAGCTDNVGIVNYTWTFMNDTVQTLYGEAPSYVFTEPGVYVVTLTILDEAGNSATGTFTVTVNDVTPPTIIGGGLTMAQGSLVTLDASASIDNVGIIGYEWSFNDGANDVMLTGEIVNYTFTNIGNFTLTITAWDAAGNIGKLVTWIDIVDMTPPDVLVVAPGEAMEDVPLGWDLIIVFTEEMDRMSVQEAFDIDGANVSGFVWDLSDRYVTISFVELEHDSIYNFTVGASAMDIAGNLMGTTYTDSFQTAIDTTPVPVPTEDDTDGDGVDDIDDAFPNDPAASVDTDGDGQPDTWNPGYTAEDSTTNLTEDLDDDGDGVLDVDDDTPAGDPVDDAEDGDGGNDFMWIIIIIILVVIIVLQAMMKGKKPEDEVPAPEEPPVEETPAPEPAVEEAPAPEAEAAPEPEADVSSEEPGDVSVEDLTSE